MRLSSLELQVAKLAVGGSESSAELLPLLEFGLLEALYNARKVSAWS